MTHTHLRLLALGLLTFALVFALVLADTAKPATINATQGRGCFVWSDGTPMCDPLRIKPIGKE